MRLCSVVTAPGGAEAMGLCVAILLDSQERRQQLEAALKEKEPRLELRRVGRGIWIRSRWWNSIQLCRDGPGNG